MYILFLHQTFAFDNCFWSMDEKNPKFQGIPIQILIYNYHKEGGLIDLQYLFLSAFKNAKNYRVHLI